MLIMTFLFLSAFVGAGCATSWQAAGRYSQATRSEIAIDKGLTGAEILVNNERRGYVPARVPVDYEREYQRETRHVTFWQTQPALAVLLSVGSLGLYLPFSAIPCDTETRHIPQDVFTHNRFKVQILFGGKVVVDRVLDFRGEPVIEVLAGTDQDE